MPASEEEQGSFDLDDVADVACKKAQSCASPWSLAMSRVSSTDEVLTNWDAIKRVEKAQRTTTDAIESVAKTLPALWRAEKIQSKAAKPAYDWAEASYALAKPGRGG